MNLKQFACYLLELMTVLTITTPGTASDTEETRVLNGTSVPQGKYPSQVSIKRKIGRSFCGGSILNADYVLTAAHCLLGEKASHLRVVSSTVNLTAGGREHQVVAAIVHENFTLLFSERIKEYAIHDIALLKVEPRFNMESGKQAPVTLPSQGQQVQSGKNATVIGWGYTQPHGFTSPQSLQELELTVVSDEQCEAAYFSEGTIHPQLHLCAGAEHAGDCNGDSGGPLFVGGVQVGVVSFGAETCGAKPGVYTEVSNYIDWIKRHAV